MKIHQLELCNKLLTVKTKAENILAGLVWADGHESTSAEVSIRHANGTTSIIMEGHLIISLLRQQIRSCDDHLDNMGIEK